MDRAKIIVSIALYAESLENLERALAHLTLILGGRIFVRVEASTDHEAAEKLIELSKEVGL